MGVCAGSVTKRTAPIEPEAWKKVKELFLKTQKLLLRVFFHSPLRLLNSKNSIVYTSTLLCLPNTTFSIFRGSGSKTT